MATVIVLHEQTGQPASCMRGLARYADRVSRSPMTDRFPDVDSLRDWLWRQPVKLDLGDEGHIEAGCIPEQRSRLWPKDGLNCWESTAHWLGWHLRNASPIEAHLFDSRINGQRHVFPAARYQDDPELPKAVVLQPPASSGTRRLRMQSLIYDAAQALGPLPPPLQLIRRKEYWPWDNVADFVVEMGGIQTAEHTGPLPESVLSVLPPFWRSQKVRQWPTANGDLLFLILEKDWVPSLKDLALGFATGGYSLAASKGGGHGFANILRIPGGARSGAAPAPPSGAPPANALCACTQSGPAQAWYNDLLGGTHYVGDKVLRVFGMGSVSDYLSTAEGDALPDWARTDDQKKTHETAIAKQQEEALAAQKQKEENDRKQAELTARKAELQAQFAADERRSQELLAQIREAQQRKRDALDSLGRETPTST